MKTIPSRAIAALAGAAMMAVGCTDSQPTPEPPETSESSVIEVETSPGVSDDGFEGARDDVEDFSCFAGGGGWSVVGTVTNPLQEIVDYRIYTSFRDSERGHALIQIDVTEVEPGATREWSGDVDVNAEDLRCVLRVERTVVADS